MPDRPDLRASLLRLKPDDVGIAPSGELPRVWGALMELGVEQETASLVVLADGTTSLYTSTGGGVIGGGTHACVADASKTFLAELERHLDAFQLDTNDAGPEANEVVFRALTYTGRAVLAAPERELRARQHPAWPLYIAGHEVLTQLRFAEDAPRAN